MPEILPMRADQAQEARLVIYTTAHLLFHEGDTFAETLASYETTWPLTDVLDFQARYIRQGGVFFVLCDQDRIVGTGALRRLEEGVGEIKRLWLLPEYQGQGLGYRMMMALLDAARAQGYSIVRLETSPAYQARAYAFYLRLGFREIPRYGDDPDDVGMELSLE